MQKLLTPFVGLATSLVFVSCSSTNSPGTDPQLNTAQAEGALDESALQEAAPLFVLAPGETLEPYDVVAGDSLWKIARQEDSSIRRIMAANQLTSDKILAGQVLQIPTLSDEPAPTAPAPLTPLPPALAPAPAKTDPQANTIPVIQNPGSSTSPGLVSPPQPAQISAPANAVPPETQIPPQPAAPGN